MNRVSFRTANRAFEATGSKALYWPQERLIVVSDLHLGKSERMARRSGHMLPPYETRDTLARLDEVISHFNPKCVICLGDSFDDIQAGANLDQDAVTQVNALMAGRDWIWIEGNHDPGPLEFGGRHLASIEIGGVSFRHIAAPENETFEVSGHYHPKARVAFRGRTITRPSFLFDQDRIIMPSFGTYTGGLYTSDPALSNLMGHDPRAILTGVAPHIIPMPR